MIKSDGAVGTLDTYPSYRHQICRPAPMYPSNQSFIRRRRLLHNHPTGDPTPSSADIAMTKQIVEIARPLGVEVHDHLVIGKAGHASFRALRLM